MNPVRISPQAAALWAANARRVLAADDQQHILDAIELLLSAAGLRGRHRPSPALVREALSLEQLRRRADRPELHARYHLRTGRSDLLSEIVAIDSNLPVIVMTAWANVQLAVEAMRRGARDFIQKPWDNERLVWPSFAPRSNSIARCRKPSTSKPRTACCARRTVRTSSPPPPP